MRYLTDEQIDQARARILLAAAEIHTIDMSDDRRASEWVALRLRRLGLLKAVRLFRERFGEGVAK